MVATGVRWQVEGEEEREFVTGDIRLVWAPNTERPPVVAGGWSNQFAYPYDEPGKSWHTDELEGHYLSLEGYGQVLDILSSLAGADHPIRDMVYREGREQQGLIRRYYEDPAYEPLTFPLAVNGQATVYLPLSSEAKQRLQDTYYVFQPAVIMATDSGPRMVASGVREYGLKTSPRQWRYWVPYYIYTWE